MTNKSLTLLSSKRRKPISLHQVLTSSLILLSSEIEERLVISSTGMSRLGKTSISLSLQRAGKALGMEPLAVQRAQEEHSTASNLLLETRSSMGKLPKLMMKMCVPQT